MPAPVFEFTDRATPVVQFGRSVNRQLGNDRWHRNRWGVARWGTVDWEPMWADATCEIHDITVNTGRGSASDRFKPGTAEIVASNVTGLSTLIFPELGPQTFAQVPQPPISHEEDLEAPAAATITSTGWSFTDDFERAGYRWVFPSAWATTGTFPAGPFKQLVGDRWAPELYADPALTVGNWFEGNAAAQWTRPYPAADINELVISVDPVVWPAAVTAGTPTVVFELYARMNTTTKACECLRVTYNPGFGATANTIVFDLFRMAADGSRTTGVTTPHTVTLGAVNGAFPAATFGLYVEDSPGIGLFMSALHNGVSVDTWFDPAAHTGNRVGVFCHIAEGKHTGATVVPAIIHISGYDFDDDLTRPTGSGWYLPKAHDRQRPNTQAMIAVDGAMRPPEVFASNFGGLYKADGLAYFDGDFDGDQFFEFDVTGVSMPDPLFGPCDTYIEVFMQGNRRNQSSLRCSINYLPDWDGADTTIFWEFFQAGPNDEEIYWPGVDGEINLGATGGVFPEPARWRVEADTVGECRLYLNGVLQGAAVFPDPPGGGSVGVWMVWDAGGPDTGNPRPSPARLEQAAGGLREPLGTEELGTWVRVGVDHDVHGNCWFFRGFVDAIVPTYLPNRQDAVRIECIDSLGEAGRQRFVDTSIGHQFAEAHTRIQQILKQGSWPRKLRTVGDDATVMSRPASGKAVDALTHIAESCGGAVYGDPITGHVVFWGQDWQAIDPGADPDAYITNYLPDDDILRVCPVGWEMSQHRQDMCTRARFSTVASVTEEQEPIVREWRNVTAEAVYGVELTERTLLCVTAERLRELINRHLRLRSPRSFPRIEAVVLDAATAQDALDLMATTRFTRPPSRYQCQLRRGDEWVFNRQYLVTGIRHRMSPTRWECRLQLDIASAFVAEGARWGRARWSHPDATWGRTR